MSYEAIIEASTVKEAISSTHHNSSLDSIAKVVSRYGILYVLLGLALMVDVS